MTFGEKVKAARDRLLMNQSTMAQELGVAPSTVNRWEHGHHEPNLSAIALFDEFCKRRGIEFKDERGAVDFWTSENKKRNSKKTF